MGDGGRRARSRSRSGRADSVHHDDGLARRARLEPAESLTPSEGLRVLRHRAERKAAQETWLGTRLDAARAEFFADAQLFSFRAFQNDASRNQFLEYVRAQLER